jgi:hypothetical protein
VDPANTAQVIELATLMGNGILPLIDEKVRYQDFFDNDEILTYKNEKDLNNQIIID